MTKAKNHAKPATKPATPPQPETAPPTRTEAIPAVGASPPPDSAAAAEAPAKATASTAPTSATTAGVEPLKLTKQGHAELMSSLAKGLRKALDEIAMRSGFVGFKDARNFPHWVEERREMVDALATYEAEVERVDA